MNRKASSNRGNVSRAAIETLENRSLLSASFPGGTYTQDFDAVTTTAWSNNSTLTGWSLFTKDSAAISSIVVGTGSVNTGGFYTFGNNADRALGGVASGNAYFGSPASGAVAGYQAVSLTNTSGAAINSFEIRYDGEQWRNGGNTSAQTATLQYGFGSSFTAVSSWTTAGAAFDFTSPVVGSSATALDGNAAANRQANIGGTVNATWAPGQQLWVRWIENNDVGNDHGLAIDNFKITAGVAAANSEISLTPMVSELIHEPGSGTVNSKTYTVTRSNTTGSSPAVSGTATIAYSGNATASDLVGSPTVINWTIPAGQSSATFTINVADDTIQEADETFNVTIAVLALPPSHVLGASLTGSFIIGANDAPPPPPATLGRAPTLIAISDSTQNFGNTQRAVSYYDVSAIDNVNNPDGIFGQVPLFSVWMGYEQTTNNDYEDVSAMTVNPANGDTYVLSFDSGTAGTRDAVGDMAGDYDLYRYDIGKIYADFISNDRPRGIMYHPGVTSDGINNLNRYGTYPTGEQLGADGVGLGIHINRSNNDADTSNDFVFIDGAINKIGEIARIDSGSGNFFNEQNIEFVDADTLLLLENKRVLTGEEASTLEDDYQIRTIERVSKLPGAATFNASTETGGFSSSMVTQSTESWESFAWTGANYLGMDTGNASEVDGMRYVEKNGVRGVWLSERDGGGDDFEFRTLDFDTRTVSKPGGYAGFALDENVTANDNGGDVDFFDVDEFGTLIIGESGFSDSTQHEPKIVTQSVTDYSGNVTLGTATQTSPIVPTVDDDAFVTDGRFGVYERGQNRVYYFDADATGTDAAGDVYVYDMDTGSLIYQEKNAANHFFVSNQVRAFTLGDFAVTDGNLNTHDGIVDQADIDTYYARIADPTVGGRFSSASGQEMFDLDGDDLLTTGDTFSPATVNGDMDYLVRRLLATEYGDSDLNGSLDADDQFNLDVGVLVGSGGWLFGDFNGDGLYTADDQSLLDLSILVNPTPSRV